MSTLNLSTLNPAQLAATLATEGPLLVLAGAGSGKTRVLTYRIAHLVENLGVSPYQILAITFTNKAAAEMRSRLGQLLYDGARGMWVATFHAMCVRMLRQDAELLGYTKNFTIYDDYDSRRLVKEIYSELDLNPKILSPNAARELISRAKNELVDPIEFEQTTTIAFQKTAARLYTRLQQRLRQADAMDFDDLLFNASRLLSEHPEVLAAYQSRFRYILVDEYQDTNHAQYQLTTMLAAAHRNLMVVGDDDQSIYSWRGADLRNILEFERDYPDAQVIKLEQNYRSTARILNAANAVIAKNQSRKPKVLFTEGAEGQKLALYLASDERDEGRWIAAEVEKLHRRGRPYSDFAVFYRTNAQSRVIEDMLLRAGVPYRIVGGTRFFDRAEIRDVIAYLKLVVNPADDMAAKRVINVPRRGLGNKSIQIIEDLAWHEKVSFMDACQLSLADDQLSPKARESLARFLQIIQSAQQYRGELRNIVEMIIERSGYLEALAAEHSDDAQNRIENVLEFYSVADEYDQTHGEDAEDFLGSGVEDEPDPLASAAEADQPEQHTHVDKNAVINNQQAPVAQPDKPFPATDTDSLAPAAETELTPPAADTDPLAPATQLVGFMEWLALRSDLDSLTEGSDYMTLMTVHSAKGLEFPVVFMAGMEDGLFPHFASLDNPDGLEEERRLAYVAITRAQELLYISHAQIRNIFGSTQTNVRSLFIADIPAELMTTIGVGSAGFNGTGYEKRGDRRGVFGSGSDRETSGYVFGSGVGMKDSTYDRRGTKPDSAVERESEKFALGDLIDHKTFGLGTITAIEGDALTISFERTGDTRKFLIGYTPLVKIKQNPENSQDSTQTDSPGK